VSGIISGSPLHDSVRSLAAHLKSAGVLDESAIDILRGLVDNSRARVDRPQEWQDRRNDIPRAVFSAQKFSPDLDSPANSVPAREDLYASLDEMRLASLAPRCIVKDYLYADVAQVTAPGGTGKTTQMIYESICIALGRPVWGHTVESPGWVLIVSAEDERERLIARIWHICEAMELSEHEIAQVRRGVLVWDVTGEQRKLIFSRDGNLMLTTLADDIVEQFSTDPPQIIQFDPLVSFGVAEERINDNEQALIMAARRMVKALGCCVRYIHHTGKANAREKKMDQYAGRGGSALADGSRMTVVLATWEPGDTKHQLPAGLVPDKDSSITILARAKLSYSPPNLPLIWIKRTGFKYEHFVELKISDEDCDEARRTQLVRFISHELSQEHYHTKTSLRAESRKLGMPQAMISDLIESLLARGDIVLDKLPESRTWGNRQNYLRPAQTVANG
jgi:RecA-family ATPase